LPLRCGMTTLDRLVKRSFERLLKSRVDDSALLDVANAYAAGTVFEGKVMLNRPNEGSCQANLHLVVLRSLTGTSLSYMRPCSFIGECNTIVCDYSDLDRFRNSAHVRVESGDQYADVLSLLDLRFKDFLLKWLIGHEIGHVVNGDNREPVRVGFGATGPCFAVNKRAEEAADKFVVRRILDSQEAFWSWMALSNFIVNEFGRHVSPESKLDTSSPFNLITLRTDIDLESSRTSHPPLIMRALDMAVALRKDHPYLENTDYFEQVKQRIRLHEEARCF
jgi:hypothetical protein